MLFTDSEIVIFLQFHVGEMNSNMYINKLSLELKEDEWWSTTVVLYSMREEKT